MRFRATAILPALLLAGLAIASGEGGGMFGVFRVGKGNFGFHVHEGQPIAWKESTCWVMSNSKNMPVIGNAPPSELSFIWTASYENSSGKTIAATEVCFDGVNAFGEAQGSVCISSTKPAKPGASGRLQETRDRPAGDIQKYIVRLSRVKFADGTTWEAPTTAP